MAKSPDINETLLVEADGTGARYPRHNRVTIYAMRCHARPLMCIKKGQPEIMIRRIDHYASNASIVGLYMMVVTYFFLYRVVTLVAKTPFLILLVAR